MDIGALPKLQWVPVDQIDVDHNYQRELDPRQVNKILGKFKWDHFGAITLVPAENGRYFVTDGQHRLKAASLHPKVKSVPATIASCGEAKSAASNFLAINRDRKSINTIEKYWAGVAAEDADYLLVKATLEAANCEVVPEHGYLRPHMTHSVAAVLRSIKRDGQAVVTKALKAIRIARPDDPNSLKGIVIQSVSQIVGANPEIELPKLWAALSPSADDERNRLISAHRDLNKSSALKATSCAIVTMYNRHSLKKQRIEEPEARK
jgi:hypothetical protein